MFSMPENQLEANRARYPSTLLFPTCSFGSYVARSLIALMRKLSWSRLAVINDQLSGVPIGSRSFLNCLGALTELSRKRSEFHVLEISTDSITESFLRALGLARDHSQIILSCTLGSSQRQMLATAHSLNMTHGDYVFIHLYAMETAEDPPLKWQLNDSIDQPVKEALQSVLILRTPPVNWAGHAALGERIQQRKVETFGGSAPVYQQNELALQAMDIVAVVTKLLNGSCSGKEGRFCVEKFRSTVFDDVPLHSMQIRNGRFALQAVVQQYEADTDAFQVIFQYDSATNEISESPRHTATWIGGSVPRDRPLSGRADTFNRQMMTTILAGIFSLLALFVGLTATLLCVTRRRQLNDWSNWWMLDEIELDTPIRFSSIRDFL
ncbi:hypothetical protein BV898_17565 [Hypsibius exemplaris]|uniref:Receptor ligand binding region domain-containing protein n=1 Tax=Hypsibius exemplaris TaxID=2072580 RepID=A0A9X6NFR9_HYPEX|nr:hypothetical protein BV898_17565 [Hypsibius exemplaris]